MTHRLQRQKFILSFIKQFHTEFEFYVNLNLEYINKQILIELLIDVSFFMRKTWYLGTFQCDSCFKFEEISS